MLEISTNKIARVILRAREIGAKVARWDTPGDDADAETILEGRPSDATEQELWIGRETFEASELEEAIRTAREEAVSPTEDYLLGIPLLADYLEDGLEALGYSVDEVVQAIR